MQPTPVLYFATHHFGCGSGVAVTGSHNPSEYNGLKMMLGGLTLFGHEIAAIADETTSVGIPLRKENTEKLRTELNKILSDMRTSGELSALAVQFFGTDISKQ